MWGGGGAAGEWAGGRLGAEAELFCRTASALGTKCLEMGPPSAVTCDWHQCPTPILSPPTPCPYRPLIEAAAKAPLHSVYAHIDPVPLAAASVAQVHVGVLRASGKRVAIKVLRPGIEDTLRTGVSV